MILPINNYGSFVYSLVRRLGSYASPEIVVAMSIGRPERPADGGRPGRSRPQSYHPLAGRRTRVEAGMRVIVLGRFDPATPILGDCLGNQGTGAAYGALMEQVARPMRSKTSVIVHDGSAVFFGLPSRLGGPCHHSLVIARESVPPSLSVLATSAGGGKIMEVKNHVRPAISMQFHFDSTASGHSYAIVKRLLHASDAYLRACPSGPIVGVSKALV